MTRLARLSVQGFKSIRELHDFELAKGLNVLIGANGAGKSNFIGLFSMLADMIAGRLQLYVRSENGPDALLFGGRKRSRGIDVELYFGANGYHFTLVPAANQLVFETEETYFHGDVNSDYRQALGRGHAEAKLPTGSGGAVGTYVLPAVRSWRVYHFHDTSSSARVRLQHEARDNLVLKPDAENLASFLLMLRKKHRASYSTIVETIRMVAPFFGDFLERDDASQQVELEWLEADDPDTPRGPLQLSDGTLRFICLVTLLLQPIHLQPDTIIVDEPELGLHPYALATLGALLRQASENKQIVVSTQSVELVNQLSPEDIIVVERHEGASAFRRLDPKHLEQWLEDYALGELWKMNVVGGRPTR